MKFVIIIAVLTLFGCGKDGETPISLGNSVKKGRLIEESADGEVKVYKENFTKKEIERQKRLYVANDLVQIPVDPKYNASLFVINNVSEYENSVFLAPKIFVYGGEEKGRLNIKHNEDGTMTISLPVILIDGINKAVPSSTGRSQIFVPDTFLVQHIEDLKKDLADNFGKEIISSLPGCPQSIHIRYLDQEFDATPKQFKDGDFCQLNTPFTATFTLPEQDAKELLQEGIYKNAVDINVRFETRVRLSVAEMEIEFDKNKIFAKLEASFEGKYAWVDAEAKVEITKVMEKELMKVRIVGDREGILPLIVSKAIEQFFEKFRPGPKMESSSCSKDAAFCFRLNYSYLSDSRKFSVKWIHSKNELIGQNFITWAKLTPQDNSVAIGGNNRRPLKYNHSFETGLTVFSGDILEITPSYLEVEKLIEVISKPVRTPNKVCLKKERYCKRKFMWCWNHDYKCVKWEDRWIETVSYGKSSEPKIKRITDPLGQTSTLFEGLVLEFSWTNENGTYQKRSCPLTQLYTQADGGSILARLENKGDCDVFTGGNQPVMLHLKNKIANKVTYKKGDYTRNWKGEVLSKEEMVSDLEKVSFGGSVRIRGYSIGSSGASFSNKI